MSIPLRSRSSLPNEDAEADEGLLGGGRGGIRFGKHSTWTRIPYREIAIAIAGVAAFLLLGFGGYWTYRGYTSYADIARPHRRIHAASASAKDGHHVVAPFFGPLKSGALVDQVQVRASIWFREGVVPKQPEWMLRGERDNDTRWHYWINQQIQSVAHGEGGFAGQEEDQKPWVEVWSGKVLRGSVTADKNEEVLVTLPGNVVHSLGTNPFSTLLATFVLLPSETLTPDSHLKQLQHISTRPVERYGTSGSWPLSPAVSDDVRDPVLSAFLSHSSAGFDMRNAREEWQTWSSAEEGDNHRYLYLPTRTRISMAADYPRYKLESFRQAQTELRLHKEFCANNSMEWTLDDCRRTFLRDGHFENLLDSQDSSQERRYGPFLTTRLTRVTPEDYVKLQSTAALKALTPSAVSSLSFTWRLNFAATSPTKLVLASKLQSQRYDHDGIDPNWSARHSAKKYDEADLYNAFLGGSFNPKANRPIARGFVGILATALQYLAFPLFLHYWVTRKVSTGLSIAVLSFQSTADMIYFIVSNALDFDGVIVFFFVVKIILYVLLIAKQLYLWSRVELQLEGYMPVALRRRAATKGEKESKQKGRQLDWRLQLGLLLITFVLLRYGPAPPPIVYAPKFEDGNYTYRFDQPTAVKLFFLRILTPFQSSFWLLSRASQIFLNYTNKTFAGSYGITTYLLALSLLLSHLTTIGVRFFGRAASMQPFTGWDVLTILVEATMVWQAATLPRVDQNEEAGLAELD